MAEQRNFDVYFEAFGRKMKTRVMAENETDAKQKVFDKISFVKIEKSKEEFNQCMDMMDDILNHLGKPKD